MTFYGLIKLLREHLLLVVVLPVVCALGMAAASLVFVANEYTVATSIYVLSRSSSDMGIATQSDLNASQLITNDVAALLKSDRVTSDAAESLQLRDLDGYDVSVSNSTSNRVITIKVTGKDPSMAADVANALAESVADVVVEVMDVQGVNVIDRAKAPTRPSGPNRLMHVAAAFLVGLVCVVIFLVLRDRLDTRVRSAEELEELLGIATVGRMPAMKEGV